MDERKTQIINLGLQTKYLSVQTKALEGTENAFKRLSVNADTELSTRPGNEDAGRDILIPPSEVLGSGASGALRCSLEAAVMGNLWEGWNELPLLWLSPRQCGHLANGPKILVYPLSLCLSTHIHF